MPEKTGGGGHISEAYDEKTGQYIESGSANASSDDFKSKMLAFMNMKKAQATKIAPISAYDFEKIWNNHVGIGKDGLMMNKENLKYAFEKGTPEAQALLGDFLEATDTKFVRDKEKTCFRPNSGNILIENAHLTATGKTGGYIAPGESLYHESFHAIDWKYGQITSNFKLDNGKTLREVFHSEIYDKKYAQNMNLFNAIKGGFESDKMKYFFEMYTPQQIDNFNKRKVELEIEFAKLNQELEKKTSASPSIEAYNNAWDEYRKKWKETKKQYIKEVRDFELPPRQKAQHKWIALSDICSFIYKSGTSGSPCGGHPATYWSKMDGKLPVMEMFAELGQKWATNDIEGFNRIAKYFPETAKGFKEILGKMDKIKNDYLAKKNSPMGFFSSFNSLF